MAYNYVSDGRLGDKEYYKKPKYPVVIEALKVFLLVSGIVPIMLYAGYELADGTYAHAWYAIGYLLMPWLSTYVRRCIPSVILYFVLHLVMGAWVLLSPFDLDLFWCDLLAHTDGLWRGSSNVETE